MKSEQHIKCQGRNCSALATAQYMHKTYTMQAPFYLCDACFDKMQVSPIGRGFVLFKYVNINSGGCGTGSCGV